jgi:hypothetical protein
MGWRVHLPSVELVVRRAGVADTRLRYFNPAYPGIAGRLDPWIVPLSEDSAYSFAVPTLHYNVAKNILSTPALVQAKLTAMPVQDPNVDMPGLRVFPVWVGMLESNWLRFPDECG